MLTSNVGLIEIPHVVAPAGSAQLAAAMASRKIEAVCPRPIWFISGIKNFAGEDVDGEKIAAMDIMRGEEVEVYGIVARVKAQGPAVFVLPGSHNKYAAVDEENRIEGCMTTIAGELIHSLTFDTIVADAVKRGFAKEFCEQPFLKGVEFCQALGLGRGGFMARILNQFYGWQAEAVQNYLLGLILADDMYALKHNPLFAQYQTAPMIVAGKPVMQAAYQSLLKKQKREVALLTERQQRGLSGFGAMEIAKIRGLMEG